MAKALVRHQRGEARVIPVILYPCRWQRTPLGSLPTVPKDAKPVSEWPNHDAAFNEIAAAIERTIADLQQQRCRAAEQRQQEAEVRKRAEIEVHQAAEEQQREAQRRREQDEARRAAEAEATHMPKTARKNDARKRQQLNLMTAVSLVVLAGFAGVMAWQQWPTQEQPRPAETTRKNQEKEVAPAAPAPALTRRALKPLDTFTDCEKCPEMVMIPGGTFMMGSPTGEEERDSDEGPQHRVTIAPFAMGKTEVTFAEWDACVAAGGCNGYRPDDRWGRGSQPVIHVSWKDAKAYVSWLSQSTGKPYRLPSEAEWEYAARAGTTTRYAFGDAITPKDANYGGTVGKTTEVGAYLPNPWGLYDMHGNVWEWVEDIYHISYKSAPTDGTAWTDGEGEYSYHFRIGRGGSWYIFPRILRSASRGRYVPDDRIDSLGFRVARTLD